VHGSAKWPHREQSGTRFFMADKNGKKWTSARPMGLFYLAAAAKPKGRACKRGHKFAEHSGQKGAGGS